jgi:DNA-binding transcriptional ArsR family regulator
MDTTQWGVVTPEAEAALVALAAPHRRRILRALADGPLNNKELMAALGLRQAAVSHHTTILLLRGLVERRRRGKCNYYRLTATGRKALAALEALA